MRFEPTHTSHTRRDFLRGVAAAAATLTAASRTTLTRAATDVAQVEYRNRQSGMAYRQLGRTGFMISEVISGGDPVRLNNYKQIELAIDMGLNYLDMAPAYGRGECEQAYAKIIAQPGMRDKVFMNTKISGFNGVRIRLYQEIFDGLPSEKKNAIEKRAKEMLAERGAAKPGYWFEYYPGMMRQFESAYRANAMVRDYRHKVEGSPQFREMIVNSLEDSLKRVGTDHFDICMCPHGACCHEEVQIPEIYETFDDLKKQGKVRAMGVSSHNDPAGVLRAATETGKYDVVMMAYNVCNGGYLEEAIRQAHAKGVGVIAMKVAMAVATQHKQLQPIPEWRIQKVNRIVPGDMKAPMKAYLWALQNPNLTAVISNLWNENFVRENLSLAGKKVELQPG